MAKLIKEFADFHDRIRITDESDDLRQKRDLLREDLKDYLPEECDKISFAITKSDLWFIDQGSYKIRTTIVNPYGSIDLDSAVIIPIDIYTYNDPRKFKVAVKNALSHVSARTIKIKEPCVTVSYFVYGEEVIHIDFPVYAQYNDLVYLARGKENCTNPNWERADPEGLSMYFIDRFNNNEQLRRVVRYLKKWKLEKYHNSTNSHEVPPSIAISLWACTCFISAKDGVDDFDLKSIYETLKSLKNSFIILRDASGEITSAQITCNLPVEPYTDVLYKMRESSSHLVLFYNRLCQAVSNLESALNLESEHEAAKYVQKVFGEEFTVPPKAAAAAKPVSNREQSFGKSR